MSFKNIRTKVKEFNKSNPINKNVYKKNRKITIFLLSSMKKNLQMHYRRNINSLRLEGK